MFILALYIYVVYVLVYYVNGTGVIFVVVRVTVWCKKNSLPHLASRRASSFTNCQRISQYIWLRFRHQENHINISSFFAESQPKNTQGAF